MAVAQLGQRGGQVRVRTVPARLLDPDRLAEDPDRARVVSALLQDLPERRGRAGQARVMGREPAPEALEAPAGEPLRLVVASLLRAQRPEGHLGLPHLDVVRTVEGEAAVQRDPEERIGPVESPELSIHAPERVEQLGLDRRLRLQRARVAHAAVEKGDDPQALGRPHLLVLPAEEVEHEPLDPLRPLRLRQRRVAGHAQPERVVSDQSGHQDEGDRRRGDDPSVAADELPGPITDGVRPRLERLAVQVVVDVAEEGLGRPVPPLGVRMHRREAEDVQVGPRRPGARGSAA